MYSFLFFFKKQSALLTRLSLNATQQSEHLVSHFSLWPDRNVDAPSE